MTGALDNLTEILADLWRHDVVCVGDIMLDVEVTCTSGRVSPEAPILVFAESSHQHRPGGAANVAASVAALGANIRLCGTVGNDPEGLAVSEQIQALGVEFRCPQIGRDDRPTTRKTRFIAGGQQVLRVDREVARPITDAIADDIAMGMTSEKQQFSVILVSDYGKGVVTSRLIDRCLAMAVAWQAPILVDPKGNDWALYGAVDLIKPNAAELASLTGLPCETDQEVETALQRALSLCHAKAILVTRAADGASLVRREKPGVEHFPAHRVEVADVCGAGDTNLAALGVMLASGQKLERAVSIAQLASSIAVGQHGNALVTTADLLAREAFHPAQHLASNERMGCASEKIVARSKLNVVLTVWRAQGLRIGFTNGCFDLLHPGHIRSLETAKAACDRLIVGLNSDVSVQRLKGPARPIVRQDDRAHVIAAVAAVDAVVIFDEDTPESLICEVRPDALIKGGDYDPRTLVGADFVRGHGGRVIVSDLIPDRSTTRLLDTVQRVSPSFLPLHTDQGSMAEFAEFRRRRDAALSRFSLLSPREKDVARLCANGMTAQQIGKILNISSRTAESHRSSAIKKLRVDNVVQLANFVQYL